MNCRDSDFAWFLRFLWPRRFRYPARACSLQGWWCWGEGQGYSGGCAWFRWLSVGYENLIGFGLFSTTNHAKITNRIGFGFYNHGSRAVEDYRDSTSVFKNPLCRSPLHYCANKFSLRRKSKNLSIIALFLAKMSSSTKSERSANSITSAIWLGFLYLPRRTLPL